MTDLTVLGHRMPQPAATGRRSDSASLPRRVRELFTVAFADRRFRYLLVGGWNTVFGYAVFTCLTVTLHQHLHYVVILLMGHVLTVSQGFVLHRSVVYRVTGHLLRDFVRFQLMYAGALAANAVLLLALVHSVGLPVLLAQALIVTLLPLATYFAHKHFTFRRTEPA